MNKSMRVLRAIRPTCAYLALTVLVSGEALAQTNSEDERWFQVEMIVFAQGGAPEEGEELWRPDITLAYPDNWLELVDMTQLQEEEMDAESAWTEPSSPSPLGESWQDDPAFGSVPAELSEHSLPLLPAEELSLRSEAQRLGRNNQYHVLFHGGWRQPFVENRQEPSVLITGGEKYDDHYELEGSIQLNLRTYLHLDSNLWLSRFTTNFGQGQEDWPALPQRPNQPINTDFLFRLDSDASRQWQPFGQTWDYEAILAQPYLVENIMLLNQSRRMRSNEVHYLDHPKMGLLIKLTPYEPETADTEEGIGR